MSGVELSEVELSLRCEKWAAGSFGAVWSEAGGGGRGDLKELCPDSMSKLGPGAEL